MIDSTIYSYIDGKTSIKDAWEALAKAFSDTDTCRKVRMEEHVNKMTNSWARLKSLGFKIDEEVGASILLAGLPNEYKTMILGLEQTTANLTMDFVKNLLLQGSLADEGASYSASSAFLSKGNKKFRKIKCFNCGGPHFAKQCSQKKKHKNYDKKKQRDEQHVLYSAMIADDASDAWYVDSRATSHMTRSDANVDNSRELPSEISITVANNGKLSVKATGDVVKKVRTTNGDNKIIIKNCQFVPDLCTNLLSVAQMVQNDNTVIFSKNGCIIYNTSGKVIATADQVNNMFKLNTVPLDCTFSAKTADDIIIFHRRM